MLYDLFSVAAISMIYCFAMPKHIRHIVLFPGDAAPVLPGDRLVLVRVQAENKMQAAARRVHHVQHPLQLLRRRAVAVLRLVHLNDHVVLAPVADEAKVGAHAGPSGCARGPRARRARAAP